MSNLPVQEPPAAPPSETGVPKPGLTTALLQFPRNLWDSIFRHPLPDSDLGAAQTSFSNFFLHIHPV